ncbi:ribonuclease H-like domain-containing protein [Tanacetum coccineum]
MIRTEFGRMITKNINDMTIAEYMEYEAEMKKGNIPNDYHLFTPQYHYETEEVSSNEDVDEWLNEELSKHMTGQDKEEEDALIDILKIVVEECNFTLPCTIGNLKIYAMGNVGAGINMIPKSLFKHLKLANLKKTSMVIEMVIDMLEGPNETILLGRPFLATIHAHIGSLYKKVEFEVPLTRIHVVISGNEGNVGSQRKCNRIIGSEMVRSHRPPKHLNLLVSSISPLPKSYTDAFNDQNWQNAMYDEYNALIKNNTWTLVPRHMNANIVRCMWLFRHKHLADGTLRHYKDRLVANGNTQLSEKLQLQFFKYLEDQDHIHFSLCGSTKTEDKTLARASVQLD